MAPWQSYFACYFVRDLVLCYFFPSPFIKGKKNQPQTTKNVQIGAFMGIYSHINPIRVPRS